MTQHSASAFFRQAADIPDDAPKGLATSEQTWGHYRAEHAAFKDSGQRKYKDTKAAQQHADEICDKEGLSRVKVRMHRAQQTNYSRYDSKLWVKPERKYMPVVSLGKASYNEGTLIHELAHHKHLTTTFPDGEITPEGREKYFADDEGGHGGGFQQHYHQMISDHHSGGQGFADAVRGHAQEGGFWKASVLQAEATGEEGPGNKSVLCPSPASGSPKEWFHGSGAQFDHFEFGKDRSDPYENYGPGEREWNSRLGAHFSGEHRVATDLGQDLHGHAYHVHLDMKNPKHYTSENDLDSEGRAWALANGHGDLADPDRGPADPPLTVHPRGQAAADGFRQHLQAQGHDGITYGNHYEGTDGHTSAIAFHPGQVTITHSHNADEPCEYSTACEHCGRLRYPADGEHSCPYCVHGSRTATAFFAQAATDRYTATTKKEGEHAPRGTGGDPAPRGHAGGPAAREPERDALRRREAAAEGVEPHPELQGDLDRLGGGARHVTDTIDALHRGGSGVTTYPLSHPLEGWHAALTPGGHQVVHRHEGDTLHVGYAGHNITDAEQRLGDQGSNALPVHFHGGAEKDFDSMPSDVQGSVLDTVDRLSRREPRATDHALGLPLRGWSAAHVPGHKSHRVTHRYESADGTTTTPDRAERLFIGHIGPHNYNDAIKRLTLREVTALFTEAFERDNLSRGMNVTLPPDKHAFVHDERQPLPARAHLLLSELKKPSDRISNEDLTGASGGLGEFWTRNHGVADDAALAQHETRPDGQRSTNVTLHARHPGTQHFWSEMAGGHGEDYEGNYRVPLHPGTPLDVHAISWGEPGGARHHYDFSEPVEKHAAQAVSAVRQTAGVDDGKLTHRAPGPNDAPLHDPTRPTAEGGRAHEQENLDNPDWGGMGEPHEESMAAVHRARGNSEAPVTIYRAAPHGVNRIRTGDWVATSAEHARMEAAEGGKTDHDGPYDPDYDWPVLKATVPAKHVRTDGNDINEWGYNGPHIDHPAVHGPDEDWTEPHEHSPRHATFQQTLLAEAAAVDNSGGVMVALVPPREIAEQLAMKDGQPADDLHVTLAYLGKAADYTPEQLKILPQVVSSWALRQKPFGVRIGGTGKFANKDEHVLYASIDFPRHSEVHTDLARYLRGHGYELPSEHGWTPHMTLAYVDRHFRFMPHLEEHRWTAEEVVTEIGGTRHHARLGTIPSGRHAL
ncbi:2'-5' RNA ligase family protein [Streptomyces sp. NPDC021080]|uniref:2'-5' RNA ligase family protein n=1 Tax=Streptomyces sp. NPDC021080 TaxID=3365110 RepID=UPI0037BBF7D3